MRGLHKTNIEVEMGQILNIIDLKFVEQYPIRCKYGYVVDFFIPSSDLIIEADGEHWHKLNNNHDRRRDGFLKNKGFKILRFRGNEILNNSELVKNKILSMM